MQKALRDHFRSAFYSVAALSAALSKAILPNLVI